ncbi:MAG: twin-arginine translocation signal domain-containing protein, partial [Candidatus Aminicenantes bacterium]|nr:twin-arginine translocation signal domain-containing protein [Candidatus Aminicenantes bacterium]
MAAVSRFVATSREGKRITSPDFMKEEEMTTRREFLKTAAAGGAGLWLKGTGWPRSTQ